ncbi:MAG: hypothetical protein G01um1014106_550 [Parcubacteria group bacterium Gr01-1014_106]|nr:MAG: hypothetical protein G01um1014106_550 [Parcubacteria group bacterium Gr01-1014_106]
MELSRQQKIAYGTIGLLVIVFLVVLVYLQVSRGRESVSTPSATGAITVEGLGSSTAARPFDVTILRDPRYQAFDRSLLDQGRIPVRPPAGRGKPNIF